MPRKWNKGKARKAKAKEGGVKEENVTVEEIKEVEVEDTEQSGAVNQIAKDVSRMLLVDALGQGREEISEDKQAILAECISGMSEEEQRALHQKIGGAINANREKQRKAALSMMGYSDEQQALLDKLFADDPDSRDHHSKLAIRDVKLKLAAVEATKQVEILFDNKLRTIEGCMHGFSDFSNRGAYEIIKMFFHEFLFGKEAGDVTKALLATMSRFAQCWASIDTISMVQSYFLWLGTDRILNEKQSSFTSNMCAYIARIIEQHIEHVRAGLFGKSDFDLQRTVNCWLGKAHELIWANDRALVSFFRKRIPCKCLDEKNEERKGQTKSSMCYHEKCKFNRFQRVEKSKTMCCSRCRSAHYCSRDCQVADWPRHKLYCQEIKNE